MYATQQNIIDLYGNDELAVTFDRDNDGTAETSDIEAALTRASEEIDGYLSGRYTTPLTTVPGHLVTMCVDIAMYKGAVNPAMVTEEKRLRYRDAIRYLEQVANGKISLGIEKESLGGQGGAAFFGNDRIMTRDNLKGIL